MSGVVTPPPHPMIPALLSWSGGKDAAWALHVLRQQRDVDVVGLLTTITEGFERISMQGIRVDVLLIDLDTLVRRLPALPAVTTVLPDFYRPQLMGSGFMFLTAADRSRCWAEWINDPSAHMRRCRTRERWGDQGFLQPLIGGSVRWGANVVSWKVHCKAGIPPGTDVVCFHGKPRPWEVGL